tara:strand:+ start:4699 stop:5121 length:423 start_codon:yes stop_codon:yes gene_type:complete
MDLIRRRLLQSSLATGAVLSLNALLPTWARSAAVTGSNAQRSNTPLNFDLAIRKQAFDIAGGTGNAITINDTVPGPLLEWYEGQDVILNVTNHLREATSIHWHGILLPFDMDGVPGVSFRGIAAGDPEVDPIGWTESRLS